MQKTAVNRAAVYVKANAGASPEGAEPDTQMLESEEFCKCRGLDVAVRYSDDLKSREEFQRMMADAAGENLPFDHVVVWKLRYFAWSLGESVLARDKLAANGVRLLSVKERLPKECVEEDNCEEALDTERGVFVMCSWVMSRGELAPEGFEAAEWQRFDTLCEGLEGMLALPKADALLRIEDLQAETDRISEGIRADIEPRELEKVE